MVAQNTVRTYILVAYDWCAGLGEPSTDGAGAGHGWPHPQRQGRPGHCARVRAASRPGIPPGMDTYSPLCS